MPPSIPRKRVCDSSPRPGPGSVTVAKRPKTQPAPARKATLFDSIDATATPGTFSKTQSPAHILAESDDDSSLTSLSDQDFNLREAVVAGKSKDRDAAKASVDEEDDEDDDVEFEDVQPPPALSYQDETLLSGNLELTLNLDGRISLTNEFGKKGPSKRERLTRNACHRVHVMFLLWHNAARNSWLCDPEVQGTLLSHLPPRLWDEYDRWRRASGLDAPEQQPGGTSAKSRGKKKAPERSSRDWGEAARRLESGVVDMSHGDPLFRLIKALSSWWKQRFRVTAPGCRKVGYMSLERLDRLTKAFKKDPHDSEKFGECIRGLEEFRLHAKECTGSRDVGGQLFTAFLRGLGLEARMVASLQPLGYGWSKYEDADPEKDIDGVPTPSENTKDLAGSDVENLTKKGFKPKSMKPATSSRKRKKPVDTESDDFDLDEVNSDDDLVVEIPKKPARGDKQFDKDLDFPHYWTEVLSPVTGKYLPVDPIVKSIIATNRELVESFEPRGAKTEKNRQVIAYVVGFSHDGTAKDVTVRYLKRQMLPGRTKGVRYPVEKVPVYNKHGKVKHYDQIDWIKSVLHGYSRGARSHPITEVDEDEDSTDLRPAKVEKKEVKEGEETLQYYKQSKEFVLKRHLKREEALLKNASPIKVFKVKGKGGEVTEEDVFLRKDVVQVKSAETWHKQGRAPITGENPLKMVPYRAATINRKREIAMAEASSGQKVLQGLYSYDQTDWIIPPPIKDGKIPKNEYGNIDLFVEHMCPEGAVHVPYRGVVKVCRRLDIDYAEAVVDFEFGHRMAVPVIQGVVIAEEHHDRVMEELAKDEKERTRKEDEKRRAAALAMWRKMLMAMRITQRLREEYAGAAEDGVRIFGRGQATATAAASSKRGAAEYDEDTAGGFLPAGFRDEAADEEAWAALQEQDGEEDEPVTKQTSSYFAAAAEDDEDEDADGGLVIEDSRMENLVVAGASVVDNEMEDVPVMAKKTTRARSSRRAAAKATSKMMEAVPDSDEDMN